MNTDRETAERITRMVGQPGNYMLAEHIERALAAARADERKRGDRYKRWALAMLKRSRFFRSVNEAFWNGDFACPGCERDTNNGRCWDCMHGKIPETPSHASARAEGAREEREAIARWMQGEHNPPCHEREHLPGATTVGTCRNCSIAAAIRARDTEDT